MLDKYKLTAHRHIQWLADGAGRNANTINESFVNSERMACRNTRQGRTSVTDDRGEERRFEKHAGPSMLLRYNHTSAIDIYWYIESSFCRLFQGTACYLYAGAAWAPRTYAISLVIHRKVSFSAKTIGWHHNVQQSEQHVPFVGFYFFVAPATYWFHLLFYSNRLAVLEKHMARVWIHKKRTCSYNLINYLFKVIFFKATLVKELTWCWMVAVKLVLSRYALVAPGAIFSLVVVRIMNSVFPVAWDQSRYVFCRNFFISRI